MGIVLVKELILIDKAAAVRVGDLKMRSAPQLNSETRLYDMLRLFETGRCHMAVLAQNPGTPLPGALLLESLNSSGVAVPLQPGGHRTSAMPCQSRFQGRALLGIGCT